jgi:uncharacterized DUF497 family protein
MASTARLAANKSSARKRSRTQITSSPRITTFEDEREQRYLAIGMTRNLVLVVVVFVDRSEPAAEIIHIISARKAVAYEQSIYEDQIG